MKTRKMLNVLLALCMILALIPAFPLTASAETSGATLKTMPIWSDITEVGVLNILTLPSPAAGLLDEPEATYAGVTLYGTKVLLANEKCIVWIDVFLEPSKSYTISRVDYTIGGTPDGYNEFSNVRGTTPAYKTSGAYTVLTADAPPVVFKYRGTGGVRTTYDDDGWYLSLYIGSNNDNDISDFDEVWTSTRQVPNTALTELCFILFNPTATAVNDVNIAMHGDVQIDGYGTLDKIADNAPITPIPNGTGFTMKNPRSGVSLALINDNTGKYGGETSSNWWGDFDDYEYNIGKDVIANSDGNTTDPLSGVDSAAAARVRGITLEPYELRVYSFQIGTGTMQQLIPDPNFVPVTGIIPNKSDLYTYGGTAPYTRDFSDAILEPYGVTPSEPIVWSVADDHWLYTYESGYTEEIDSSRAPKFSGSVLTVPENTSGYVKIMAVIAGAGEDGADFVSKIFEIQVIGPTSCDCADMCDICPGNNCGKTACACGKGGCACTPCKCSEPDSKFPSGGFTLLTEQNEPSGPDWSMFDTPSDWAKAAYAKAISLDLLPHNLKFNCRWKLTRAEFCALAVKFFEYIDGKELPAPTHNPFTDTTDENVLKLARLGIVEGVGNGKFRPNDFFTREMALTLMYNMMTQLGYSYADAEPGFADAESISKWARKAVGALQRAKVVQGDGENFNPSQVFTREMGVVTVVNFL